MSYQVLARKFRPTKFSELVGQEFIATALLNSVRKDRAAHAFLFVGSRGVGKTSCARILTKALNCLSPEDGEPCNRCEICLEINKGSMSDVYEIDAASNRGIEHIRNLRDGVSYAPSKCRFKVYIIDEVHMLTIESFNALLKTLEEPPPHVKFILATTDAHKIPRTIVSRCQHYEFRRIGTDQVRGHLAEVANEQGFKVSDKILELIAAKSMGGLRDALTSLEMLINFVEQDPDIAETSQILGWSDPNEIMGIVESVAKGDVKQALDVFGGIADRGISLQQILADLMALVKTLAYHIEVKGLSNDELAYAPDRLNALLKLCSISMLGQYFSLLLESELLMRKSSMARICLEMSLIKMCKVENLAGLKDIIDVIRAGQAATVDFQLPAGDVSASAQIESAPKTRSDGAPSHLFQAPRPSVTVDADHKDQSENLSAAPEKKKAEHLPKPHENNDTKDTNEVSASTPLAQEQKKESESSALQKKTEVPFIPKEVKTQTEIKPRHQSAETTPSLESKEDSKVSEAGKHSAIKSSGLEQDVDTDPNMTASLSSLHETNVINSTLAPYIAQYEIVGHEASDIGIGSKKNEEPAYNKLETLNSQSSSVSAESKTDEVDEAASATDNQFGLIEAAQVDAPESDTEATEHNDSTVHNSVQSAVSPSKDKSEVINENDAPPASSRKVFHESAIDSYKAELNLNQCQQYWIDFVQECENSPDLNHQSNFAFFAALKMCEPFSWEEGKAMMVNFNTRYWLASTDEFQAKADQWYAAKSKDGSALKLVYTQVEPSGVAFTYKFYEKHLKNRYAEDMEAQALKNPLLKEISQVFPNATFKLNRNGQKN